MRNIVKLILVSLVVVTATSVVAIKLRRSAAAKNSPKDSLIVHEWGTFTSIAGKDGVALEWRPLNGSTHLPKFVHTMQSAPSRLPHPQSKADMAGTNPLETPGTQFFPKLPMC